MWSHWGPRTKAFQAGQQDKCSKLIGQNIMSLSFRSSQTDKSKHLLNRNLTPPMSFPSFHTRLSDYRKFDFLKVPFVDNPPSSPPGLHSRFILFFYLLFIFWVSPQSSFFTPFCSQTKSLLDATWDTFSSPVPRFSPSLFPGLKRENPLLPSPIGCHHFPSTLIVPSTRFINVTHRCATCW